MIVQTFREVTREAPGFDRAGVAEPSRVDSQKLAYYYRDFGGSGVAGRDVVPRHWSPTTFHEATRQVGAIRHDLSFFAARDAGHGTGRRTERAYPG